MLPRVAAFKELTRTWTEEKEGRKEGWNLYQDHRDMQICKARIYKGRMPQWAAPSHKNMYLIFLLNPKSELKLYSSGNTVAFGRITSTLSVEGGCSAVIHVSPTYHLHCYIWRNSGCGSVNIRYTRERLTPSVLSLSCQIHVSPLQQDAGEV